MKYIRFLVHFAELGLKGQNRPEFIKRLRKNLNQRFRSLDLDWKAQSARDHIFIVAGEIDENLRLKVMDAIGTVAGISWFASAEWMPMADVGLLQDEPDLDIAGFKLAEIAHAHYKEGQTFAVRVRRSDKRVPIKSQELERQFGGYILRQTPWEKVKLKNPDQTFQLDLVSSGAFFYSDRRKGMGGLPVNSSGRCMVLLSGGFDSPIAALLMAKRGANVDFVHFTANLMQQSQAEQYKITRIVRMLSEYTGRSRLFMLPYTHFDLALMTQEVPYDLILFRRFMARLAEAVATQVHADVLVTGDNLGQVASQTMPNMISMNKSIEMPIFRPLLTYDKEEIIQQSYHYDLFEICKEPYKDCCALISRKPRTQSQHDKLTGLEERCFPNYAEIIHNTLSEVQQLDFECGKLVEVRKVKLL